jgi:hypothetical protein
MPKMGCRSRYLVAAAGVAAALAPASLLAGSRIAPVAAMCPAERPERAIDADGERDRCVARADPTCPSGAEPRTDVTGPADACVVAGSTSGANAGKGKPPKCGSGFRLRVAAGKDACEKAGPPLCPSGSSLMAKRGEDQCHY